MDLAALSLTKAQLTKLVMATGALDKDQPTWTYSDIRTRLYPRLPWRPRSQIVRFMFRRSSSRCRRHERRRRLVEGL